MSLLLFDIDGTLLLSGGAGIHSMTRAFAELFGVAEAFASSDVAGRTDTYILSNALRAAGVPDTPENHRRFREAYVAHLRSGIGHVKAGRYGLMPGVAELIEALRARDDVHLALLTGNFRPAAYIKLEHFAIAGAFPWGAFGEESADRNELARIAMQRAEERRIPPGARERAIVIGDTPHDIACARTIGARVLAVATGNYSAEELARCGADIVLEDLSDTGRVLEIVDGRPQGRPVTGTRPRTQM